MSGLNSRMADTAQRLARERDSARLKRMAADPYQVPGRPEGAHPPLGKQWDNIGKRYVPKGS